MQSRLALEVLDEDEELGQHFLQAWKELLTQPDGANVAYQSLDEYLIEFRRRDFGLKLGHSFRSDFVLMCSA
jgi:hypothetical protein